MGLMTACPRGFSDRREISIPEQQSGRTRAADGVAPAPRRRPDQDVRRRHVFYVHGYDPRDPAVYRQLATFELRRFARLWDVSVTVDRADVVDETVPSLRWNARLVSGEATVETTYETLRWDDLVRADFDRWPPVVFLRGLRTFVEVVATGLLFRVARAAPWCALAWIYPMAVGGAALGAAGLVGWLIQMLAASQGWPVAGALAGAAAAFGLLFFAIAALKRTGAFIIHLIDDGGQQRRYAHRSSREMEARVDRFADRIAQKVLAAEVDEVLVVGHSSGSFVGIDAVARAYERHEGLGRGAPLSLLTVGASELVIALHPAAGWFRERIRRLAVEPTLFWAEVVGPWDTLNFPNRDPVSELKLDVPDDRPNPTFRRAYLSKMLTESSIVQLRKGFRVFKTHFQFIFANEVRGPYDYFSLVMGPWSARSQFMRTQQGRLMSPTLGPAPLPLPRPGWLPPLPGPDAPKRSWLGRLIRP